MSGTVTDWVFRGSGWRTESRTYKQYRAGEVILTKKQVRSVLMSTYEAIGYSATESGVPTPPAIIDNPTSSSTTGAVYSSSVKWNNITGQWRANKVQRDAIAPATNPDGWHDE